MGEETQTNIPNWPFNPGRVPVLETINDYWGAKLSDWCKICVQKSMTFTTMPPMSSLWYACALREKYPSRKGKLTFENMTLCLYLETIGGCRDAHYCLRNCMCLGCEITVASNHICCNYDEKDETTVMVNKSTNINKTYNHLSSYLTEHKQEHDIWRWNSRSWFRTGRKTWRG